jgi:lipid-binding SYLF domain-containing protein
VSILYLLLLSAAALAGKDKAEPLQRLDEAATVFQEIMGTPDRSIPQDLLDKAHCIVIVPGLKKGAFIIGGKYGKGFLSCRKKGGGWSAPGTVRVEGGSIGFQIGGSESDVIMLVTGREQAAPEQVHAGRRGRSRSRSGGPGGHRANRCQNARRDSLLVARAGRIRGYFVAGRDAPAGPRRQRRDLWQEAQQQRNRGVRRRDPESSARAGLAAK